LKLCCATGLGRPATDRRLGDLSLVGLVLFNVIVRLPFAGFAFSMRVILVVLKFLFGTKRLLANVTGASTVWIVHGALLNWGFQFADLLCCSRNEMSKREEGLVRFFALG
jgi:hypothetical protein